MRISPSSDFIDTGITWIGSVPSDWKMVSIKSIAKIILGKMRQDKPASEEDTLEKYLCAKDVHLDGINWYEPKEMYFSPNEKRALLVKDGDLLIVEGGAGAGGAFVAQNPTEEKYYVQNSINIVRAHKCVLPQYLYYWINKLVTNGYVEVACNVATIPHFTKEKVSSVQIPLPSLDTQRRIVSYLDSHVSSIDKRVSLLTTKRDHYLRLKTAIINRAVTQGLNPDVKMKDSGVEWIGMIPEHWEIRLFKNVMKIRNGRDYKHIEADEEDELSYPVIGSGGPFAYAKQAMYSGEVLFLGRKGTIDRPLYWNGAFWTVDTMFYAIPTKKTCCRYMYYLSLGFPFWKIGTQTALPSMTQTALNSIVLCHPPLFEQQAIATYLDEKCAKIDAIVENLNQQIEKHKLLKRALINEVITGQRAV